MNASRPTEHPPAKGEKMLKRSHFSCILAWSQARLTAERSIFSSVARKIRERCEPKDHLQQSVNQSINHIYFLSSGRLVCGCHIVLRLFCFVFFLTLSLKQRPFTFVQSFFDVRAPRQPKSVSSFSPFVYFGDVAFFRVFFVHCHFLFVWRVRCTFFSSRWCIFSFSLVFLGDQLVGKWQWYKKYPDKSDMRFSKINKREKGRNTFWLSGRPHIEELLNEGKGPLLQWKC